MNDNADTYNYEDDQVDYLREFGIVPPTSAVSPDEQWSTVICTKFGFNIETRIGTESTRFWTSFDIPFGNELKVALPLVKDPTSEPPEGTITTDMLATMIADAKSVKAKVKLIEDKEENG